MLLKEKAIEKISLYLCRHKNVQNFFVIKKENVNTDGISPDRKFHLINNMNDFEKICCKFNFSVHDAEPQKRFDNGDCFSLVTEGENYGCWGWYTTRQSNFYVLEIDSYSVIPENTSVMYHYFTNPNERRKGFYYDLLRFTAANNGKEYSIIYAYDTNTASKNAIKKAGFKDCGGMSRKSFCGFEEIVKGYS